MLDKIPIMIKLLPAALPRAAPASIIMDALVLVQFRLILEGFRAARVLADEDFGVGVGVADVVFQVALADEAVSRLVFDAGGDLAVVPDPFRLFFMDY